MILTTPGSDRSRRPGERIGRLSSLCHSAGDAAAFWPDYLEAVGRAFAARRALLLVLAGDQPWQAHAQWPAVAAEEAADVAQALELASRALVESPVWDDGSRPGAPGRALAMRLTVAPRARADAAVLVVWLPSGPDGRAPSETLVELADLAADVPTAWELARKAAATAPTTSGRDAGERLYEILSLSMALADETRFMRAALSLCNDLAVRFEADRVSLGWIQGAYVRLRAMSHVENFDRRASASRDLETAMEEAWKQDDDLVWPAPPDPRHVLRAHEAYARGQGSGHLLTLPLRVAGRPVGVLTLDRRERAYSAGEMFELRLVADAVARPLTHLHETDRWWGARLTSKIGRWRTDLLGPEFVAWKLTGAAVIAGLAILTFLPWTYWIDTGATLRGRDVLFVPAPFDGFLGQVHVDVGDAVQAGSVLVELDSRELVLEESMAVAEELRQRRDVEKAQAGRQFGDMQVAIARQQQSTAKLDLIRHQLGHAQIRAPFAGVVVEGDLKKNLGAPVRKGDMLLKLASTGQMELELEVDQADVHEVVPGMRGEFALVGRPDQRYTIVVDRIDPVSTQRDGRNVFVARARTDMAPQGWWRPGMGGAARLDAGERSLLWIMTHRTVRFVRHALWL